MTLTISRRAYRMDEVSEMLGVSVRTLGREINDGKLSAHRLHGAMVEVAAEIHRYLAVAPTAPSGIRLQSFQA